MLSDFSAVIPLQARIYMQLAANILFSGRFYQFKWAFWCGVLIFVIVKIISRKFSPTASLKKVDAMSGEDFEQHVADVLIKNGFKNVCLTKANGDFGIDVIGNYRGSKYAVQVKRYNSLVGITAVQEVYAGATYYEADAAIVITNSHFTDAAQELAESCNVILINREQFFGQSFVKELR